MLTEGPFDALAVAIADPCRYAPVSLCGSTLTRRQAALLRDACTSSRAEVLVALDADRAGRRAAVSAYQMLSSLFAATTAVVLPVTTDPAHVLCHQGAGLLAATLGHSRRPLADLVVDAELDRWTRWLCFAEGQITALRAVAPIVSGMAVSDVGRQVGRLAERLGLDHPVVTEAVTDALTRQISAS